MRSQKLLETYAGDILHSKGMDMEKRFFQHGMVTVFDHSVAVALMCLQLAALLRLRTDTRSLVRERCSTTISSTTGTSRKRAGRSTAPTMPAGP